MYPTGMNVVCFSRFFLDSAYLCLYCLHISIMDIMDIFFLLGMEIGAILSNVKSHPVHSGHVLD